MQRLGEATRATFMWPHPGTPLDTKEVDSTAGMLCLCCILVLHRWWHVCGMSPGVASMVASLLQCEIQWVCVLHARCIGVQANVRRSRLSHVIITYVVITNMLVLSICCHNVTCYTNYIGVRTKVRGSKFLHVIASSMHVSKLYK